jgi:hypothetical protein
MVHQNGAGNSAVSYCSSDEAKARGARPEASARFSFRQIDHTRKTGPPQKGIAVPSIAK